MNQKAFIEKFRLDKYGINADGVVVSENREVFEDLTNAIEQLSTGLYGEDVHFLLELIQNAEDNSYEKGAAPDLGFKYLKHDPTNTLGSDGCLCVINNESGFTEKNIRSISAIGKSTKTKKLGYIGEKGIGFKSVFIVSSTPHIFSNGYHILFKDKDQDIGLSYIVPYWIEALPEIVKKNSVSTVLLLPIRKEKKNELQEGLAKIKPESILFLSKLEALSIHLEESGEKVELIRDISKYPIVDLLVSASDAKNTVDSYRLYKQTINVPGDLKEEKREDVEDREITLAFPISKNASQRKLFAYLPTEVEPSFPFLLSADFILTANRESIQPAREWNKWIRNSLAEVIVKALVEMRDNKETREAFLKFIPMADDHGQLSKFFSPVSKSVCESLSKEKIVLNDIGILVFPDDARMVAEDVRKLFNAKLRPEGFKELHFVDKSISKYKDQLKAVGVPQLLISDFKLFLSDIEWNKTQGMSWFVKLFKYLSSIKNFTGYLPEVGIIPLDDGTLADKYAHVYLPTDSDQIEDLSSLISGDIPSVNVFNQKLYKLVSKDRKLLDWVTNDLDVQEFSISSYTENNLVPWLDENSDNIEADVLLSATHLIIKNWGRLTEKAQETAKESLPVLLVDGSVVSKSDLEGEELLLPKLFNPDNGWQVFLTDNECAHHDVLSDMYVKKSGKLKNFDIFDEVVNAIKFPGLKGWVIGYYASRQYAQSYPSDTVIIDYVKNFKTIDNYTFEPKINTVEKIAFLNNGKDIKNKKKRAALLRWLENSVPDLKNLQYTSSFYINKIPMFSSSMTWYFRTNKSRKIESLLLHQLKHTPWLNSTKGFKRPSGIFLNKKSTKTIFGNRIAYLSDPVSENLCEILGIKTEVTEDAVVDYIKDLATEKDVDKNLVASLYEYLERYGDVAEYQSAFNEEALIYIPDSEKEWYLPNEVIWEDASSALGDLYGWLSPAYDGKDLRSFFVSKLNIAQSANTESYANAWISIQDRDLSNDKVESALELIYPKLLQVLKDSNKLPVWWDGFVNVVLIWSQDREFLATDEVFARDDDILAGVFDRGDIQFVWKPKGITHVNLKPFYNQIGVTPLSEVVTIELASAENKSEVRSPEYLSNHSKLLIASLLYHETSELFDESLEGSTLHKFMCLSEWDVSDLSLDYKIEGSWVSKTVSGQNAYLDMDDSELIINAQADSDDVNDEVSEAIARLFWGSRGYKRYVDTVSKCLGVNEQRKIKLVKKNSWGIPKDIEKQLFEFMDTPPVEVHEDENEKEKEKEEPDKGNGADIVTQQAESPSGRTGTGQRKSGNTNHAPSFVPEIDLGIEGGDTRADKPSRPSTTDGKKSGGAKRPTSGGTSGSHGHRTYSGSSRGKSRSSAVSKKIRNHQQRQVPVYVSNGESTSDSTSKERQKKRMQTGADAEAYVIEQEVARGWKAKSMNDVQANHPGYDIELTNPDTGELLFVEVKGIDGPWGERGVGVTTTQFDTAKIEGDAYWLFVVENVYSDKPRVHKIKNPANQVTRYYFNESWSILSEQTDDVPKPEQSLEELMIELKSLTDSGGDVIDFCHAYDLILPVVGYEMQSGNDEVMGEIELAWPDDKVGIWAEDGINEKIVYTFQDWTFYTLNDVLADMSVISDTVSSVMTLTD
ncbi:MAG: DUF3883 domain-containing protein [Gammaproteobacteria bacterium]|nr:DUF3883 domain-containing protein [Gammaproteobacteria bacterium]